MSVLKRLMEKTPVEVLRVSGDERNIVEIPSTLSISDGFQVLLDNNVLSAPVYDPTAKSYVGFLDLRDLVSWAVFLFDEQENPADDELDLINAAHKLYKHATGGISLSCLFPTHPSFFFFYFCLLFCPDLARRNPFRAVKGGSNLASVAAILKTGVKRVPVLNDENRVTFIISQTSVNRFLYDNIKELKGDTSIPLCNLSIGRDPVLAVPSTTAAIETFRLMDNKHISGVAVVDEKGCVIANTSSRDLKNFVKSPRRSTLLLPIAKFLEEVRKDGLVEAPVVCCSPEDTLAHAMVAIATTNVHRVYVVDASNKPLRVITLTDVMKYIS